jgi:polysaccharide pyruvyl transferase WcaK-like protein
MYIVWKADIGPSQRLYNKINDPKNVTLSTHFYHQTELLRILQNCIFTMNLKLHANVLSATAEIPFITLGYRFKSFDFAYSVGMENYSISTNSLYITDDIQIKEELIIQNKSKIVEKLQFYKKEYSERLVQPFKKKIF